MKIYNFNEIGELVIKHGDINLDAPQEVPIVKELKSDLKKYLTVDKVDNHAVLGIDMYQYSQYKEPVQTLIPFILHFIFRITIQSCLSNEEYLFQKQKAENIWDMYIDTGDGGFLIFETPIHAISFATRFATLIRLYNSYRMLPTLRAITKEIEMRFALTYDKVYCYEREEDRINYYGSAIINNSRILNKDSLNRFLIDENTYNWFMLYIDGIENLSFTTTERLNQTPYFKNSDYNKNIVKKANLSSFHINDQDNWPQSKNNFQMVQIQKIGSIKAKKDQLSIYNLHIQAKDFFQKKESSEEVYWINVTLGNLHTEGITD